MEQTTNTAATTLEQVNAMPAATWGWLKMNQTKLELSDELAAAPAEATCVSKIGRGSTPTVWSMTSISCEHAWKTLVTLSSAISSASGDRSSITRGSTATLSAGVAI